MNNPVGILLSTYNGEMFVEKQIQSLLDQDYDNFRIYIRDDDSRDKTVEIIQRLVKSNPDKIVFLSNPSKTNLGIRESFEFLMKYASNKEKYFLYCDQDDFWVKNKLSLMLNSLLKLESEVSLNTPALSFSDMKVMNEEGECILGGYYKSHRLTKKDFLNGMYKGVVSGCLMIFNQAAIDLYFRHNRVHLHDYNMFVNVYIWGNIDYLNLELVYRIIHSGNAIGTETKISYKSLFFDLIKYFFNNRGYRKIVLKNYFLFSDVYVTKEIENICFSKGLYTSNYVNKMSYFDRKKWYYKYFKPFKWGLLNGAVNLALI